MDKGAKVDKLTPIHLVARNAEATLHDFQTVISVCGPVKEVRGRVSILIMYFKASLKIDVAVVELLIANGAELNMKLSLTNPLYVLAQRGNDYEVFKLLLNKGCDQNLNMIHVNN